MKLRLPCIVASNIFALQRSIFVPSDFTLDVVHSGLVDSQSLAPVGYTSFFRGFPSFFSFLEAC